MPYMHLRCLLPCAALCVELMMPLSANGQLARAPATVFADGMASCANWSSYSEPETRHWILGFWSGLNMNSAGNRLVGNTTDNGGVLGEVWKECQNEPSENLAIATLKMYDKLDARKR